MGFLSYVDTDKSNLDSESLPSSLNDTAIIVISTASTFAVVLLVIIVTSYCFRKKDVKWTEHSHQRTIYYTSDRSPIIPVVYSISKNQRASLYTRNHSGKGHAEYPANNTCNIHHQGIESNTRYPIISTNLRNSRSPRNCQYNSYPGGIRILRAPQRSANMRISKPVMIYRPSIKPMYTQIRQPSTVPPLRLNNYKPKIIGDNVSPYNILETHVDKSKNVSYQDSSQSQNSYDDFAGPSHRWYPDYSRQVFTHNQRYRSKHERYYPRNNMLTNQERTRYSAAKSPPPSPNRNRVGDTRADPTIALAPDDYVIIDYLVDREDFESTDGPMSTSTPRTPDLDRTDDTAENDYHDIMDTFNKRQRLPHHGSIDKVPLLH